jgi:Putative beta-barrel porin 2
VTAGAFYDDNIFATHTNLQHDWAFFARPEMQWIKQGQNYTFAADGYVEGRDYDHFTSENQINGGAGAGFTETPDDNTQIVGGLRYIHAHLDRGSSETVVATPAGSQLLSTLFSHPVSYDEELQSIALNKRYGNWWSSIGGAGMEIQYQNATIGNFGAVGAGTVVDLGYADGGIGAANARLGYVVAPLTSVFVEAAANAREWGVGYFDSTGYRLVVGLLFEQGANGRLKGEAWAGYMSQAYGGTTMQNISTWTYGLSLVALVTDDVTAVFEGRREAKEAALGLAVLPSGALGASQATCVADLAVCVSDVESEIGGRLDYRIILKVVVGGGVTYLEDDYQGPLAFGRIDRSVGPLASLKYFATPNVTLGFDYRNLAFSSGGGGAPAGFTPVSALSYHRNVYMASISAKW